MEEKSIYAEFWNKYTETLPREKLQNIEFSYFKNLFSFAKSNSALCKEKFKGIDVGDIKTFEDIKKIPFTYKEELRKWQEDVEPFPYVGLLGVDIEKVSTFRQTSGTTGDLSMSPRPMRAGSGELNMVSYTLHGWFPSQTRVFLPFRYNVYVAFWEAHYAAEKNYGCEVVPGGALDT